MGSWENGSSGEGEPLSIANTSYVRNVDYVTRSPSKGDSHCYRFPTPWIVISFATTIVLLSCRNGIQNLTRLQSVSDASMEAVAL